MTLSQKLQLKRLEFKRRFGTMTEREFRELAFLKRLTEKAQFAPPEDKAIYGPREIK